MLDEAGSQNRPPIYGSLQDHRSISRKWRFIDKHSGVPEQPDIGAVRLVPIWLYLSIVWKVLSDNNITIRARSIQSRQNLFVGKMLEYLPDKTKIAVGKVAACQIALLKPDVIGAKPCLIVYDQILYYINAYI